MPEDNQHTRISVVAVCGVSSRSTSADSIGISASTLLQCNGAKRDGCGTDANIFSTHCRSCEYHRPGTPHMSPMWSTSLCEPRCRARRGRRNFSGGLGELLFHRSVPPAYGAPILELCATPTEAIRGAFGPLQAELRIHG